MAALNFPVMPGYNANPHGINLHCGWDISDECNWVRNNISAFGRDHYGMMCVTPRMGEASDPADLVDQYEMLLPHVKHVRPIINLYGLGETGEMNPQTDAVWTEFAERGWKILLTVFDGPSQRYYDSARGAERNTVNWIKRHEYTWHKLAEYLDGNRTVRDALYAIQPQNEPAAFNQMRSAGSDTDAGYLIGVTNYTRLCDAVFQIVHDEISTSIPFSIGGFQWDGLIAPLYYYGMPRFGDKNAISYFEGKYPSHPLLVSLHNSWGDSRFNDEWAYRDGNMVTNRRASWRKIVRDYHTPVINTEILGTRNNGLADMPVVDASIPQSVKALDLSYWTGIGRWWWPFSNISKARLCDVGKNGKPSALNRFCIAAITTLYSYPMNPIYFSGPQYGVKNAASADSHSFDSNSINWTEMESSGWGSRLPRPVNALRHTTYYGGLGTCRIDVTDDQLNAVMGGDGKTIVNCGSGSYDIVYLGRGGGVVRAPDGHNSIITRWGKCRLYLGRGVNNLSLWVPKTPWPRINALEHRSEVVLDPAGDHYIFDFPNGNNWISFKGAFASVDDLAAACSMVAPADANAAYNSELVISLPGGGRVQFSHGGEVMARLVDYNLDLRMGWYGPGWVEPPDYLPAELTTPPVDPQFDLLYDLEGEASASIWRGQDGQPLSCFDWRGQPMDMEIGA